MPRNFLIISGFRSGFFSAIEKRVIIFMAFDQLFPLAGWIPATAEWDVGIEGLPESRPGNKFSFSFEEWTDVTAVDNSLLGDPDSGEG